MNDTAPDRKVIQCNYAEATKVAGKGARAYVSYTNPGNGNDRIAVLVRSRGGRWVEKWELTKHLTGFRIKTLPPEHPLYGRNLFPAEYAAGLFASLARLGIPHAPDLLEIQP